MVKRRFLKGIWRKLKAFNQVRYRAGLPGLSGFEDVSEVQSLIRERETD